MMSSLVAYFSMRRETIGPNMKIVYQDKGNTQVVAESVQKTTGGELFEINTVRTYPTDYAQLIKEAKREQQAGECPTAEVGEVLSITGSCAAKSHELTKILTRL